MMDVDPTNHILVARQISKQFPGVCALDRVDLTLGRGEVLAVIGENGAGKSTLMKILAGVQQPDSGELILDSGPVQFRSVNDALDLGIALIHQELNLSDNLDIASNVFLGREPRWGGPVALVDRRRMHDEAALLLRRVGLDSPTNTLVSRLSVGQQQLVEIAKALSIGARVLIMDEPTSSLSRGETERLFQVITELRSQDVSVVYISHRLGEVKRIADRVQVLRDGRNAGELSKREIDHDRMVTLMVGRNLSEFYQRRDRPIGEPAIEVRGLRVRANPRHTVDLAVRSGEIVGVAGLVGAGRTELLETLFGIQPPLAGEILVSGAPTTIRSPLDAIRAGIALVPEDRKAQGLVLEMSVRENLSLASLRRDHWFGFLPAGRERELAGTMVRQLGIRTPSLGQIVQLLSGGNQQKVVLGKWLVCNPKLLLLDEPTRGIDVGAKGEIYRQLEQLAEHGLAILFVSSEMEEILGLADRVLVMHQGRLAGELQRNQISEEAIMRFATGAGA